MILRAKLACLHDRPSQIDQRECAVQVSVKPLKQAQEPGEEEEGRGGKAGDGRVAISPKGESINLAEDESEMLKEEAPLESNEPLGA